MDRQGFEAELNAVWKALSREQREGVSELAVVDDAVEHPLRPSHDVLWLSGLGQTPSATMHTHYRDGALWFSWPAYSASPLRSASDGVSRLLRSTLFDHHATRLAYTEHPEEEDRFAAHALFRRDEPLYDGWYRSAESLAPLTWTIDLDLFVELTLPRELLETFKDTITLTVLDIEHTIAVPIDRTDALDGDTRVLTLEGAGLIDGDTQGDTEDALAKATTGNLHVMVASF